MGRLVSAVTGIVLAHTGAVYGADLIVAPPRQMDVITAQTLCVLGRDTETWTAPQTERSGLLPAGLLVRVVEEDWNPFTDLWVRLEAPRPGIYYGWVYTRALFCH